MNLTQKIDQAIQLISGTRKVVALTGAGLSTASGIPDFRTPGSGLWEKDDPFEVASIYSFRRHPQSFYEWIHPLAKLTRAAKANPAHIALAQLEQCDRLMGLITQNIDMLHSAAGSKVVYELHGHMREMTCLNCYTVFPSEPYIEKFIAYCEIPYCQRCGGVLKPSLILMGEQLPMAVFRQASQLAEECEVLLVAGSSLTITPACDIPFYAHRAGAKVIIVNYEPTHADHLAEVVIHANVVDVLPRLVAPFIDS